MRTSDFLPAPFTSKPENLNPPLRNSTSCTASTRRAPFRKGKRRPASSTRDKEPGKEAGSTLSPHDEQNVLRAPHREEEHSGTTNWAKYCPRSDWGMEITGEAH